MTNDERVLRELHIMNAVNKLNAKRLRDAELNADFKHQMKQIIYSDAAYANFKKIRRLRMRSDD